MDTRILRIFQREVERQCKFAIMAAQDLDNALQPIDHDKLWYSVQSLLVAAGNISKLFWPSDPQIPERGDELKESLSIEDDSPLGPRNFRNHFEHFDERLDTWATSSRDSNFVDSNVGPPGMIAGIDPQNYLRNFDTTNFAVTYRGDVYDLRPVIDAIESLHERAIEEAARPRSE